jgi:hypothetical protein
MNSVKSFLIALLLLSAALALVFYFVEPQLPVKMRYESFWIIQIVMIVAALAFHYGLARSAAAGGQPFVRYFMGATSAKLMVFMMIMIVFGLVNKEQAFGFILHFFIFYICYTVLEVTIAYRQFGAVKKRQ